MVRGGPGRARLDGAQLPKTTGSDASVAGWSVEPSGTVVVRTGVKSVAADKAIEVRFGDGGSP